MNNNHQDLQNKRHSLAHLLAAAVMELYPDAKRAIGPAIDNGFYFDFEFTSPLSENDLPKIEKKMREILPSWNNFEKTELSKEQALAEYPNNPYKAELIEEFSKNGETLSFYKSGNYRDLCKGGHIENMQEIAVDSFKLTHLAGAYWRGNEKNKMLTRIYALAFNTKEELDAYVTNQEEAKKRDHRKLGKELDLFVFSDIVGKGLPLWTPKGAAMRRELERFIIDEEIKRDYLHVITPDIAKIDLYKKSGHYPYYKESMYAPIVIDDEEFMLRPMTCPHHFELYLAKPRSYKELPMRIAEVAKLYRYEQSGELTGLIRVRSFCLSDAHIICASPTQAGEEVEKALDLIEFVAKAFGLEMGKDYSYRLSLGDRNDDKKYFKNDQAWDEAENILRTLLQKRNCHFVEAEQEAAFYGPKIDIQMKNINGKEDTAFTVQYDFVMPGRFNLMFTDSDGKEKQAYVIHRSSIGAIERIMGFLIERFAGNFPLWLSPVQVKILTIAEKHVEYAGELYKLLKEKNVRVEADFTNEGLGKKVRKVKEEHVPYFLVIGDNEMAENLVTLENRSKGKIGTFSPQQLIEKITEEIKNKSL